MSTNFPTDHFFHSRGARLHYVDWGGEGRPVVLLHGLQDTARNWDHVAAALRSRHRVYALDARGHGDSEWVSGRYQFEHYVGEVGDFLAEIDAQNAVLVGHSAGGKYAFSHAAADPSRVAGIVIVDMDPDAVNPGSGDMFVRYRAESDEWDDLGAVVERLRSREPNTNEELLRHVARVMTKPLPDGRLLWKRDRQVILEYERPDAWATLPKVGVHTLIIRGADSPLLRRDVAERMAAAIPYCAMVEVPNGGHWCLDENPSAFLAALGAFLDGLP